MKYAEIMLIDVFFSHLGKTVVLSSVFVGLLRVKDPKFIFPENNEKYLQFDTYSNTVGMDSIQWFNSFGSIQNNHV